ncbi:hypothetical protein AZZ99_001734 [Serratia marcescens]|nr:hypothetical protein AZZ99_001734 [Serratia marcescens]
MKLSLDDDTYNILREESDRLGIPVPRLIRQMCQSAARQIQLTTNPQGELNSDSSNTK